MQLSLTPRAKVSTINKTNRGSLQHQRPTKYLILPMAIRTPTHQHAPTLIVTVLRRNERTGCACILNVCCMTARYSNVRGHQKVIPST